MDTEQRERFARAAEDLVTELDRLSNMLHLAGMGELSSATDMAINLMEFVEGELKHVP